MSISDLLMSQKRWGRTAAAGCCALHVPENKQLGTLTERQRGGRWPRLTAKSQPEGAAPAPAAPHAPQPRRDHRCPPERAPSAA